MSRNDGGLTAIVRYEQCARRVASLKKQIGEALGKCTRYGEAGELTNRSDLYDESGRFKTHLNEAFKVRLPCDSGYGMCRLDDDGIADEILECDGCTDAFELICERRQAKLDFGAAKRAIRTIGRAAISKAESA